jgi:hypothetical protein
LEARSEIAREQLLDAVDRVLGDLGQDAYASTGARLLVKKAVIPPQRGLSAPCLSRPSSTEKTTVDMCSAF